MGSFRRGFRNRSPLVLIVAAVLIVPTLLGIEQFFASGAWTVVPMKYWMRKASDDYTYLSWTVGAEKRHPPKLPAVYLLGGSTAREAITSGETLARQVKEDGGPSIVAYDFGSMNQNFAQSLDIVDNIPAKDAMVLVGVNLGRFTSDRGSSFIQARGRELLLKSPYLQRYVADKYGKEKYTRTILPGIFSYLASFLQQRGWAVGDLFTGREYGQHRYNRKSDHTVKQKERMVKLWNQKRYPVFKHNLQFNLDMLEQLVVRAQQRGVRVVLLELPHNRALVGDRFDRAISEYREPVKALAEKYDVPYVDFNPELPLKNDDFHDLSHLNESGRVIWQAALARELVRLLDAEDPGGSGG